MNAKRMSRLMIRLWEETKNIVDHEIRKYIYITRLYKELGLKPPIRERLSISGRGEHLSEARCPF